ncbi:MULTISPECIES: acetylornithine transaminase [unclassified Enterococcus]|uniref:acetylornithine transaminase n=1 Tax=unclassified Enterococcus TaxID=2608891 RepID=UPI001557F001|nr:MULTISPECIES: acetylornithine transaminase [unclassified Enterococcus]MBS7576360.1 acetylornithine transaminase [Enterococcus sp. MMGLQ5-2]MBS7583592.1 acetylornithine transaminase [Enterococcus sp. MMGLQ5-1]NPD11454.1 acetylornithine transaminase [Enterococcus sp. MMGLQ5-1]NPD36198.1 acetylornithine transaminase [Enterococcus sp. MMGLQ5-2]
MSHLFNNYGRNEKIEFVKGEDVYLYDADNNQYLDFTSGIGVTNLGYSFEAQKSAIKAQVDQLIHIPNLYHSSLQEAVAELVGGEAYVGLFVNSGTEANEAAIKFARLKTGKPEIITFKNGFHGRTYGSMSATAQEKIQKGFAPLVPGFRYADFNDIDSVKALISSDTAAIMLELIQGEGGVLPVDKAFITELSQLAKTNDILLMIDEVQTGIGRTGKKFAFENFEIQPDVFTLAKGLANGLPVGAFFAKAEYRSVFAPGTHGSTFGGNPVAMASAKTVLEYLTPDFLAEVTRKGQFVFDYLKENLKQVPNVVKIQGIGLMVGIQLLDSAQIATIMQELQTDGVLVLRAGKDVLRLLPPLVMSQAQLELGLEKIVKALKEVA